MNETAIIALVSVVVNWLINGLKDITNYNWNGVITRAVAYAVSLGSVVLYAHQSIPILNFINLHTLNGGAQAALALGMAASGGTISDVLRTFNRSDGTVQPTLLPPSPTNANVTKAA